MLEIKKLIIMDPRHTGEMLKQLEKQNELLKNSYKSMSYELHKLQVEEEMLMRKFYELMTAHGLTKKGGDGNVSDYGKSGHSTALVNSDKLRLVDSVQAP